MNRLASAALPLLLSGCLHGSDDLVAGTNARVVVTGLDAGDAVVVRVDDDVKRAFARSADPLVVYLSLGEGEHEGSARIERGGRSVCASFVLEVDGNDDFEIAAIDARLAPTCPVEGRDDAGAPDDAGVPDDDAGTVDAGPVDGGAPQDDAGFPFEDAGATFPVERMASFSEEVDPTSCVLGACLVTTTIDESGEVAYTAGAAATIHATVGAADLAALEARVLHDDVDALFAGEDPQCPQPRPTLSVDVATLRRAIRVGDDAPVVESVDVTGCGGVASELRVRVRHVRELAGLP